MINAGQGVLLKRTTADAVKLTSQNNPSTADYSDNVLEGSTIKTEKSAEYNYYVLNYENSKLAFYKYADEELDDHKAFIKQPNISNCEFLNIAGGATGINSFKTNTSKGSDCLYDLQGHRVVKPTNGLYIVNGKIIKW